MTHSVLKLKLSQRLRLITSIETRKKWRLLIKKKTIYCRCFSFGAIRHRYVAKARYLMSFRLFIPQAIDKGNNIIVDKC